MAAAVDFAHIDGHGDGDGDGHGDLTPFNYGIGDSPVVVQVSRNILKRFRVLCDVNENFPTEDGSFYATIKHIHDANNVVIQLTPGELTLFFELAGKDPLTIEHLEASTITPELLKRFLLLVNFLDYEDYLQTLCRYAALLINEGILTFS
jgi:hypothetical protein